jgi:hypothetical protein
MIWQITGASVIGSSHIKTNKPCQDSHGFQILSNELALIVVADGLGSAEKSEIGSRLAVDTVLASLAGALEKENITTEVSLAALENAFSAARKALEDKATTEGLPLRDLGTTLLCVVLASDWVACGQIGDGAIVAQQADGSLLLLSAPQRGEYANETVPLTMQNALEKVRYSSQLVEVKGLALISDGLQNLALKSTDYAPYGQFFDPFFDLVSRSMDLTQTQSKIEEFLGSERVLGRTDDDKTLVLAIYCQPVDGDTLPVEL